MTTRHRPASSPKRRPWTWRERLTLAGIIACIAYGPALGAAMCWSSTRITPQQHGQANTTRPGVP